MNITNNNLEFKNRKFELEENTNDFLKELTNYIPNLLNHLWENPKLVAFLLSNSNIKDIKEHLASFIVNNFYENILLSNSVDNNLMYLYTLMLKEEINNLEKVNEPELFLDNNSACYYLLNELSRKDNIRQYFKKVLLSVIENIESYSSDNILSLSIKNFQNLVEKYKAKYKEKVLSKKLTQSICDVKAPNEKINEHRVNNSFSNINKIEDDLNDFKVYSLSDNSKIDEFTQKYVANLTINDIKKLIVENYNDNENLKDYLTNQLINCGQNIINRDYYSNKCFMDILYCTQSNRDVLFLYQNDFLKITEFIDQIILNIKKNIYLLPNSLKCLCKIISKLIINKFPDINIPQKMAFISQFFIKILLKSIMNNPGFSLLIDNFIISKKTVNNIKLIMEIISQMTSGKFFINSEKNNSFTPFNWYFLDKMSDIFEIFEELTKVSLPPFIEKLVNNQLEENYKYNYFNENPDENMFYRAICFNLYDINAILNNINIIKEQFFNNCDNVILKKTFEKLFAESNQKLIEELMKNNDYELFQRQKTIKKNSSKEQDESEQNKEKKKLTYFLISSLLTNDEYKEFINIKFKSLQRYTTKELKTINTQDNDSEKNIIKVKKFLICLLYNYRNFIITDFDNQKQINTIEILNSLKEYNKNSNFIMDDFIPIEWYINSLLDYLKKIPDKYIENDFQKLYDEIEDELNRALKKIDFEIISACFERVKLAQREKKYYEEIIRLTNDSFLNERVQKIVEEEFIPVKLFFTYNDNKKEFSFLKSKAKEKEYLKKKSEHKVKKNYCKSIKSFTKKFPDLNAYQMENDVLEIQKELNIPQKLLEYIDVIKEYLVLNKKITNSKDIDLIIEKIYDYITTKIYKKIFPINRNEKDEKIDKKCNSLSWTEPKHFIQEKNNYIFDCYLEDSIYYFNKLESEKSVLKKILNIKELFNSIYRLEKFNGDRKNAGVDDLMPILNYAFIKAKPKMIYSNLKYIELYIGYLRSKEEGSQLTQLIALCDYIINIQFNNILRVTKDEYILRCGSVVLNLESTDEIN